MGWQSTNPGGSYTKKYGVVTTQNYYSLKYELYIARLTNNNVSVKVVCTPMGKGETSQGPYYPAYQYFATGSDKVFVAGEKTNTRYWVGALNYNASKTFNLGYSNSGTTMDGSVFFNWAVTGPAYTTQYAISYNANGGSGSMSNSTFTYGSSTTVKSNGFTAPTGKHFTGWKDGNGNSYSVGATYSTAANLVLYAQWAYDTYTVSFNANGGSGSMSSVTKTYGTALTLPANTFTYTSYYFLHWNTKADDTGTTFANRASFNLNANTTLYAIWSINTYQVTYNNNGGSGTISPQTKTHGVNLTLSNGSGFTRSKYVLTGWNTAADGSGTAYALSGTYKGNAALTLYAQWKKANIPVFYKNGSGVVSQVEKCYYKDANGVVHECTLYYKDSNGVVHTIT
jgi:hypothetical protein